jgi:hypothetical protein
MTSAGWPCAACPAAALRVVRRGGRHVAHVDRVQRRDIDAELHRRRAEQHRQPLELRAVLLAPLVAVFLGEAEAGLALQAVVLLDLGGVLARLEVEELVHGLAQQAGDVAVQARKKALSSACRWLWLSVPSSHNSAVPLSCQPVRPTSVSSLRTRP